MSSSSLVFSFLPLPYKLVTELVYSVSLLVIPPTETHIVYNRLDCLGVPAHVMAETGGKQGGCVYLPSGHFSFPSDQQTCWEEEKDLEAQTTHFLKHPIKTCLGKMKPLYLCS